MKQLLAAFIFFCSTALAGQTILLENQWQQQLLLQSFVDASEILKGDLCNAEFEKWTSQYSENTPAEIFLEIEWRVSIYTYEPSFWAAFVDCWEPNRIIISGGFLQKEGYSAAAVVLVHEFFHIVGCENEERVAWKALWVDPESGEPVKKHKITEENAMAGIVITRDEFETRRVTDICGDEYFEEDLRTH